MQTPEKYYPVANLTDIALFFKYITNKILDMVCQY